MLFFNYVLINHLRITKEIRLIFTFERISIENAFCVLGGQQLAEIIVLALIKKEKCSVASKSKAYSRLSVDEDELITKREPGTGKDK